MNGAVDDSVSIFFFLFFKKMVEPNNVVCLKVLEGHTRYVNTCGFSRDGSLFATGKQ